MSNLASPPASPLPTRMLPLEPKTWIGLGPATNPIGISSEQLAVAGKALSSYWIVMSPAVPEFDTDFIVIMSKRAVSVFGSTLSVILGRLLVIDTGPAQKYELVEFLLSCGLNNEYTEAYYAMADELGINPVGWIGKRIQFYASTLTGRKLRVKKVG